MCIICNTKRKGDMKIGECPKDWTSICAKTVNGSLFILAYGDDTDYYKPKYCPECGRKLNWRKPTESDGRKIYHGEEDG